MVYQFPDESQGRDWPHHDAEGALQGLGIRPDVARLPLIRVQTETGTFNLFSCVNFVWSSYFENKKKSVFQSKIVIHSKI